jgi:glutathione peroxidase
MQEASIYDFKVPGLDGDSIDFAQFKGKKILIVNTASECGYTPQYAELEQLYKQHKEKLVIVGFPANEEIRSFCSRNYGVSFPMAAKIHVKGSKIHPIYQWLTNKEKNGVMDANVKWNFNKFLIDEKGLLIAYFPSSVKPLSEELLSKL